MVQNFNLKKSTSDKKEKYDDFRKLIDTNGQEIGDKLARKRSSETWYDCSIFDCENKIKVFKGKASYGYDGKLEEVDLEIKKNK